MSSVFEVIIKNKSMSAYGNHTDSITADDSDCVRFILEKELGAKSVSVKRLKQLKEKK